MSLPVVTVIGNVTSDPELRFTPSGAAVVNFTVVSNDRYLDKTSGEWVDGDPLFLRVNAWKEYAENIAESISRGTNVIVVGKLKQRSFESNGEKRTVIELEATEVAPTLRWATAKVSKTSKEKAGASSGDW